jgi:hypothetical protein
VHYADVMAPAPPDAQHLRRYEQDLWELRGVERARRIDRARAHNLAVALYMIHRERGQARSYCRGLARALSGEEGIPRLAEWLGDRHPVLLPERLERIEIALVHWRWLLREKKHRSRRIHGSLRPDNVFFRGEECTLLETAPVRGEPAHDLAALTLRYVISALAHRGRFSGPEREIWDELWTSYLSESGDVEILEVIPPFYAREVLEQVALNAPEPLSEQMQRVLVEFAEVMLAGRPFRPDHLDGILP